MKYLITVLLLALCFSGSDTGQEGAMLAFLPGLTLIPSLMLSFSAASGLYGAYSQYQAGQAQADLQEKQAEVNAEMARREAEADAKAESREMREVRDAQKRRRAAMEAAYATSGVLLEGTPAQMLTRQRETDEFNVQSRHQEGNERRKTMLWQADTGQMLGKFQAKSTRRAANNSFIAGIGNTATSSFSNYKAWETKPKSKPK
jgi:hypothetical protein